jgi:hypothetical protein
MSGLTLQLAVNDLEADVHKAAAITELLGEVDGLADRDEAWTQYS